MKSEEDIEEDFWNKKIETYFNQFSLSNNSGYHSNPATDIQFIFDNLKNLYGESNVICQKKVNATKRKTHTTWKLTLSIKKEQFKEIKVYLITHSPSSTSSQNLAFLTDHSAVFWCSSYCKEEILKLIGKIYTDYDENLSQLKTLIQKEQKIHEIATNSINAVIPKIMSQTNHDWSLIEESSRSVLLIKLKRGKMMEIALNHKTFSDKIPEMPNVIKQIEQLLKTIPYPVNIKSCRKNIHWNKGKK